MSFRELTDAEIDLTCIDCEMKSNLTVGVDFQVDLLNATCATSSSSCFTLINAAMNFTVQELLLTAALEVYIGKAISAGTNYK